MSGAGFEGDVEGGALRVAGIRKISERLDFGVGLSSGFVPSAG